MCSVYTVMSNKHFVCSCLCPLTVTPLQPSSSCQHLCQLSTVHLSFSSCPYILLPRNSLRLEVCVLHSHSKLYRAHQYAMPSLLDLSSLCNAGIYVLFMCQRPHLAVKTWKSLYCRFTTWSVVCRFGSAKNEESS